MLTLRRTGWTCSLCVGLAGFKSERRTVTGPPGPGFKERGGGGGGWVGLCSPFLHGEIVSAIVPFFPLPYLDFSTFGIFVPRILGRGVPANLAIYTGRVGCDD